MLAILDQERRQTHRGRTSATAATMFHGSGRRFSAVRPHLRLRKRQKGYQNHGFVAEGLIPLY